MTDVFPNIEDRFASLEEASRNLSIDVRGLNDALRIVAQLASDQAVQKRRQDEADKALILAKQQADDREARRRRTFGSASLALAIILPLASILVYSSLIDHVNDLLAEQKVGFFTSCQLRNQATQDNINRERALARVETDDAVAAIHIKSATALGTSLVDCSSYLR